MSAPTAVIVADDFTGALDSSVSFALAGRRVAATLGPEGFRDAVASGADVLVVNTATRELGATAAAGRVEAVAGTVAGLGAGLVLKKIDSRLKGHVAAETAALARALAVGAIVVAPAIPGEGRLTVGGAVVGAGVAAPIPIAAAFAGTGLAVAVEDAATDADLDRIVARHDWTRTLAVGARGLGAAFARRHGPIAPAAFVPDARTLVVVGSRDPATDDQVAFLLRSRPGIAVAAAPLGRAASLPDRLPALLRLTGAFRPGSGVEARFADRAAEAIRRLAPDTIVLTGGETAASILSRLGAGLVFPTAEAAPGLPAFRLDSGDGAGIRCIVKSGGFGRDGALAALLPDEGD